MEADLIGWREAGVLLIAGVSVYLFFYALQAAQALAAKTGEGVFDAVCRRSGGGGPATG